MGTLRRQRTRRRRGFAVCASLCGLLVLAKPEAQAQRTKAPGGNTSASSAPIASTDVETAEQLYGKLDYEQANAVAERVAKRGGLTHEQLARTYRILAVTHAILDKEEQARDAFLQLLICDADYQADSNLGPKVNMPLMEARGTLRSLPSRPGIDVATTLSTAGGSLRIATRDPTHVVRRVSVGFRWASSGDYAVSQISSSESVASVEIPAAPRGRTRLDFYVQALDERDSIVLEAGSPNGPKSAFAEVVDRGTSRRAKLGDEEGGSIFSSPLFWIVAGVAVAGAGTAGYFVLRPNAAPTSASLSPLLLCGSERCN